MLSGSNECTDCTPDAAVLGSVEQARFPDERVDLTTYDPLNPATFVPPGSIVAPGIVIEFCDRCRWLHRATWTSTELFLTFPSPTIKSIALIPQNSDETSGRFRVWLHLIGQAQPVLVWDRKVEGRFPEMKELKQRVRDHIQPGKSLGHSDK